MIGSVEPVLEIQFTEVGFCDRFSGTSVRDTIYIGGVL